MNTQRFSRWNKRVPDADPTARNAMLLDHLGLMKRYVDRQARTPDEFDDLFQTACVLFLERFGVYDGVHSSLFCRWMVGRAAIVLKHRPIGGPILASQEPATFDPPPCAEADRDRVAARLRDALDQLPDDRRALIVRYYGLDGDEPATLDELRGTVTRSACGMRLTKCRRQLAEALADLADVI